MSLDVKIRRRMEGEPRFPTITKRLIEEWAAEAAALEALVDAMRRYIGCIPPKLLTPGLKRQMLAIDHHRAKRP